MATARLRPNAILATANCTTWTGDPDVPGSLRTFQRSPDINSVRFKTNGGSVGAAALASDSVVQVRVGFPAPNFNALTGTQTFRARIYKWSGTQTGTPGVKLELWKNGALVSSSATIAMDTLDANTLSKVVTYTFDASAVAGSPAGVELRVLAVPAGGSGSAKNTIDVGGLEWVANGTYAALHVPLAWLPGTALTDRPYKAVVTALGGGTKTWSVPTGSLPPGLSLNASTGLISGTATTPGSYTFTLRVTDGTTTVDGTYTITVRAAAASGSDDCQIIRWVGDGTANRPIYCNVDLATAGGALLIQRNTGADGAMVLFSPTGTSLVLVEMGKETPQQPRVATVGGTSLASDGTITTTSGLDALNVEGAEYVAWVFKRKAGFLDIRTWVRNASVFLVTHTLGQKPGLILGGAIDTNNAINGHITHGQYNLVSGPVTTRALFDSAREEAFPDSSGLSNFTTTQFQVSVNGSNIWNSSGSGSVYFVLLFANNPSAGIACGTYTPGAGRANPAAINTSFKPKLVMWSGTGNASKVTTSNSSDGTGPSRFLSDTFVFDVARDPDLAGPSKFASLFNNGLNSPASAPTVITRSASGFSITEYENTGSYDAFNLNPAHATAQSSWLAVEDGNEVGGGAQQLDLTGLASAEAWGSATVVPPNGTVSPAGIGSEEAWGTAAASVGPITLSPAGIASAEAWGEANVGSAPPQTVVASSIPSAETWGDARFDLTLTLAPVATAEAWGTATLHQSVTLPAIGTAEAWGGATVSPGAASIGPDSIPSAEAWGTASLTTGALSVLLEGVPSAEAWGVATVTRRLELVIAPSIASAESWGEATVSSGTQIQPVSLESAEAWGAASLTVGPVVIAPLSMASLESWGTADVSSVGSLVLPSIPSLEAWGAATVQRGAVTVSPASIGSAEAFGAARLYSGNTVAPDSLPSAESWGAATLLVGAVRVELPSIASAEAWGVPRIGGGARPIRGHEAERPTSTTLSASRNDVGDETVARPGAGTTSAPRATTDLDPAQRPGDPATTAYRP